MSHFESFKYGGYEVKLIPKGWRGTRITRIWSFPSGYKPELWVRVKRLSNSDEIGETETIAVRFGRIDAARPMALTTLLTSSYQAKAVDFARLSVEATFRMDAVRRVGDRGRWEMVEVGFAAIHIKPNYKIWELALGTVSGALLARIIPWLWNLAAQSGTGSNGQ